MILYNCMIVIGIYHRCFNYISIDKLTTPESSSSVSDFSVNNLLTKAIAIQGLFIVKQLFSLLQTLTYN